MVAGGIYIQLLDCTYRLDQNGDPVIHLFGVGGHHKLVEGFRPYLICEFNSKINDVIAKQLLRNKGFLNTETIYRYHPVGYQTEKHRMYKITLKSPKEVREAREKVAKIPNIFKIYESDIIFTRRYLINNDLGGMCFTEGETEDIPLKIMGFDIECLPKASGGMPKAEDNDPIIVISMGFSPSYDGMESLVLSGSTERDLINQFFTILNDYNPDVIGGYNSNSFDFDYINTRCQKLGISPRVGRDNTTWFVRGSHSGGTEVTIAGRVVIDLLPIMRSSYQLSQYTLREVAKLVNWEKLDVSPADLRKAWTTDNPELKAKCLDYARRDAQLVMKLLLDLKIIEKYVALSKASGLLLQEVINGGNSQMVESLLMREFYKNDRVISTKPKISEDEDDQNVQYKGATVLQPPKGLVENLIIEDYRSLYPTIIISRNICYSTLLNDESASKLEPSQYNTSPTGARFIKPEIYQGIMPKILDNLLNERVRVKTLMKQSSGKEKEYLDALQYAYKILLNSAYGYAGFMKARLFTIEVAESVTAYGRDNLAKSIKIVEDMGYKVVYADSDSLLFESNTTDFDRMKEIGKEVAAIVSKDLPKPMELIFEAIAKRAIFLSKKRYSMWRFEETKDGWQGKVKSKGLETTRRDFAPRTSNLLKEVLRLILMEGKVEEAAILSHQIIMKTKQHGKITDLEEISDLILTRKYTKDDYKNPPVHVKLVQRMKERGDELPAIGDRVPFIIINEYGEKFADSAENPEYAMRHGYTINSGYYVESQLMGPLERIFSCFDISGEMLMKGQYKSQKAKTSQVSLFGF